MVLVRSRIGIALQMCAATALAAQQSPSTTSTVFYDIRFPNAVHHEGNVTIRYSSLGAAPLRVLWKTL